MDGAGLVVQGRIGPNSVIQLAAAMEARQGADAARRLFEAAGCGALLDHPPEAMIDERIPLQLFETLWEMWPPDEAADISREAGRLTADYVIANRIPRLARTLLRTAPARLSARLLLQAIRKNAWTFAGSGQCAVSWRGGHLISIRDNPLIMPDCAWHAAVFARLFGQLAARGATVRHVACCGRGDPDCRFAIALPGA